jgi:diacylglycerol kinase (ATP)
MPNLRILLLTNTHSRNGQAAWETVHEKLSSMGFIIVNQDEYDPADFCKAVQRYTSSIDAVVICGGDGSVNAALPALIDVKLPFGVIPFGTSNNLSRNLGIPLDIDQACEVIRRGIMKKIDIGKVNDCYFLNVAGMGVSIEVNKTVPGKFKKYFGMVAYIFTAFKVFRNYRRFKANIITSDSMVCLKTIQISVCNGRFFASGMSISPEATIDDGLLDLCSIQTKHWYEIPKVVSDFKRGVIKEEHSAFLKRDATFEISTSKPIPIDTDGEIRTQTPARFSVVSNALEIFIPLKSD